MWICTILISGMNSAADNAGLNHWVQATPDCAFLFFLCQWSGAPDPDRSAKSAGGSTNRTQRAIIRGKP